MQFDNYHFRGITIKNGRQKNIMCYICNNQVHKSLNCPNKEHQKEVQICHDGRKLNMKKSYKNLI